MFNIKGNDYRLVVKINYPYQIIYVRFIGWHKQYDAIDERTYEMNMKPIKLEADYDAALERVAELMDAKINTVEGDELDILTTLIKDNKI